MRFLPPWLFGSDKVELEEGSSLLLGSVTRRGFLGLLGGVVAAQVIPFNRVWSFPNKIVVPEYVEPISGNRLLTIDQITREHLRLLQKHLDTIPYVYFGKSFKIGQTITIRKPARYVIDERILG